MKKCLFLLALRAVSLFAAPSVTSVSIADTANPFKVRIDYTLGGSDPAIVTFEVRTNGVPLKGVGYAHAVGDINHIVQPGSETKSIFWASDLDWPGHLITEPSVKVVVKAWATNDPPDYALLDLTKNFPGRYYAHVEDIPGGITNDAYKTDWLALRRIHSAAAFGRCGALGCEAGWDSRWTAYPVTFSKDFYIGVYPITKRQYELADPKNKIRQAVDETSAYMTEADVYAQTRPVIGVQPKYYVIGSDEWPAAKGVNETFLLGKLRSITGINTIYLPTRAQWEFACRAGTSTLFSNGSNDDMDDIGWNQDNNTGDPRWTEGWPHAVGLKAPNAWGLYDMHGNVAEYCVDRTGAPALNADGSPVVDPEGPASGKHVFYGGSFSSSAESCAAFRFVEADYGSGAVNYGYRVICDTEVCK